MSLISWMSVPAKRLCGADRQCTTMVLTTAAIAIIFSTATNAAAQKQAQTQPASTTQPPNLPALLDPAIGLTTLRLWPGRAPGAVGDTPADIPTLTVFRPDHPNGTAVIVAPGGAYLMLAANHEGRQAADRLAELGVTAFVLKYRLGPTYLYPVPLDDARRAVRLVRSLAPTYGIAPNRIGMMGFSAGGHLAALTAVLPEPGRPNDPDPVERQSGALDFQLLIYPWLNAMEPQVPVQPPAAAPAATSGSAATPGSPQLLINYCSVTKGLTQADCARLNKRYTPATQVTAQAPPAFIVMGTDDTVVPVLTATTFYTAMHAAGADAELHLFAHGPHGFGTGGPDPTLSLWPTLLENWLRAHNLLTPPAIAR